MIQASELRIGNYLYQKHLKKIDKVLEIRSHYLLTTCEVSENNWIGVSLYEPIALSDEILLMCGFAYSKPFPNVRGILFNDNFEVGLDGQDFMLNQMSIRIDKVLIIKVKYLHQLQNIWFVHKGKELNVEL